MPAQLITTDDLRIFKEELLQEFKSIIQSPHGSDDIKDRWLRSADVEQLLNISANKLYQLRVNSEIPHYRFGRTIYYKLSEIESLMIPA